MLPGAAKPRYLLASALAELGRPAEAERQLEEALRLQPGSKVSQAWQCALQAPLKSSSVLFSAA